MVDLNSEEKENAEKTIAKLRFGDSNDIFYFGGNYFKFTTSSNFYLISENGYISMSSYGDALQAIFPDIHFLYFVFGSYQSDWVALGRKDTGEWYWKQGSYGSCSGCDQLEGLNDINDAQQFIKDMSRIEKCANNKEDVIQYALGAAKNLWMNDTDMKYFEDSLREKFKEIN